MNLTSKRTLTPRLRFPEFREQWEEVQLSHLAKLISDRVGTMKCIPYTVTSGLGLVSQEEKFGRTIAGNSLRNYIRLQKNDFAYNKSATKAYPEGYIARYLDEAKAAVPNSIFTCFRVDSEKVDPAYLDFLFAGNLHGRWLRKFLTIGARAHGSLNVSDDDLMALPVPLSPTPEQQKIAECLSSLDCVIAAEGRKLEALKTHKKGLMQQLFPQEGETMPRLRFSEFRDKGEWKEAKLEKLAKRGSGHTPSKSNPEYYNGGIKWVSLADSKRLDSGLISDTEIEISDQGIKNSSAILHPAGNVLISRDAGVGKSAIMAVPMAVSQHFIVWTCNLLLLSNWFLYHLFQNMKPRFERIATGSTIKTIGLQYFKELCVTIPSPDEQQKIADCLTTLDAQISAQVWKFDALKTHKRGLMQQLFPAPEEQ